jgi:RNA polymerase sigma factor (sigma-70 family)
MKTLGEIYKKHRTFMLNYAKKYIGAADVEDVVQNVYLKIMESAHWSAEITSVSDEPERVKAILFVFLYKECMYFLRQTKSTNKIFASISYVEIGVEDPERQYQIVDILAKIMNDINKLDDLNCTIFIKHLEGYRNKELAEEFQCSLRSVESRIYRTSNNIKTNGTILLDI